MADTSLIALKAVISRLRGYGALTALVTSTNIVSSVNQQTAMPYVLIEIESEPWTQNDGSHMVHTIRAHVYSDKNSPAPMMAIMEQIYNALDRQESNLSLDSGSVVLCIFSGTKAILRENGIIWHGVIEFNLTID